jgi:DNA-binding NarL/FixJ family response regulator
MKPMVMRILIVEDSPTDRELLRYLLEDQFQSEAKFREASNLATAFRYLEQGNIDCILLDLQLPDSAGKETFGRINERYPDIPTVVMTHNKDRTLALDMIKMGAADYVLKDFTNPDDIFRRISFAIEKHTRTVRMAPEKVQAVHQLERARANMMTAHKSGEHVAIQSTTVEATAAVTEIARRMFTELQVLSNELAKNSARDEHIRKVVESLENEVLKGHGERPSMRSQMDVLTHRVNQAENHFSDFSEQTDKNFREVRMDLKSSEDTQRQSSVQIQQTHMTNKTKILLGLLAFLGALATAVGTYEASHQDPNTAVGK